MVHKAYWRVVIVLLSCATSLAAQVPMLSGKVISREKPPPQYWGEVRIKVKNLDTGQEIEGEQKVTNDQDWYHVAQLGAHVNVMFDKACYVPAGLFNKYVKQGDNYFDPVKLRKTKACLSAERQTHFGRSSAIRSKSTAANMPIARVQTAPVVRFPGGARMGQLAAQPASKASEFTKAETREDIDLLPSAKTLKEELKEEAALARRGQFFDTFQYNFRVKWIVYSDVPALREVLLEFREDKQNQDLFKQLGDVPPETFDDTIRGQFRISDQVDFENIKRVVTNGTMSPSVRGSATVAFLNVKPNLPEAMVSEMMEYYRQQAQDSSSEIFAVSVVALARNGDSADRARLYEDIRTSTDKKRVIASIKAVAVTQIIEGPESLAGGAQALVDVAKMGEDPSVRAAAFSALRPFAYRWDQTAITALLTGARRDPSPEARSRAALSLGVGDLEDVPWVRKVLRSVAKTDPSPFVRRAANLSLSGARWFPRVIKRPL
jgi:hypothetical protein